MAIKPVSEIMRELKKRYDHDKKGWKILAGKDRQGNFDMFIAHRLMLWQIKMKSIRPFQYVGFGSPIGKIDKNIQAKFELGKPTLFELISPQADGSFIIARGIEKFSSKSTFDLKKVLSPKQEELECKLSRELEKLVFKRHPELLMYG